MPTLNTKQKSVSAQNELSKHLAQIKKEFNDVKIMCEQNKCMIEKLLKKVEDVNEIKERLDMMISYTDKARLNICIKDLTSIKKQMAMSKSSKIMKTLNDYKSRIMAIEEAMVSEDDEEEN